MLDKKFKFEERERENNRVLKAPSNALVKLDTVVMPIFMAVAVFFVLPATIIELINEINGTEFAEGYVEVMEIISFSLTMLFVTYYISMSLATRYLIKEP